MILELINQYPQIIDEIHQLIQSKTDKDIICQTRKFSNGKIQTIEYDFLDKNNTYTECTWVQIREDKKEYVTDNPGKTEEIWCHPFYSKIKKQEIIDTIIKPIIRDKQLDLLV